MKKLALKKKILLYLAATGTILLMSALALNLAAGKNPSEEWQPIVEWINICVLSPVTAIAVIFVFLGIAKINRSRYGAIFMLGCMFCCVALLAIPLIMPDYQRLGWQSQYLLSGCWAGSVALGGLSLFLAATRINSILASLSCLAGSIFICLAALETALLFSDQYSDGMSNLSAQSRHFRTEKGVPEYESWVPALCGPTPGRPGASVPAFARLASFDRDLFDVKYSFNDRGWRKLPEMKADAPNDLVLFGCSFTFSMGMEDEETWAWQLANLLGSDWKLENYASSGYGANQMLCLLEHNLIEKPIGKKRYALFLAINDHLRRNDSFPGTPHYVLSDKGEAVATGTMQGDFAWVFFLPNNFNGSQLTREIDHRISAMLLKLEDRSDIYLVMLDKAAKILRNEYNTKLIVLLWPDIERFKPRLEKLGIPVILARAMFPDWNTPEDPGWKYRIDRYLDGHPNRKAARELAAGLASYFEKLAAGK